MATTLTWQELTALPQLQSTMDVEAYAASHIPRVLRQLSLVMQDKIQALVLHSLEECLKLLQAYRTLPEEKAQRPKTGHVAEKAEQQERPSTRPKAPNIPERNSSNTTAAQILKSV